MLKNYLLIAFRNLTKNMFYSMLNLTGLAVGIATFILIALYVQFELSFDRYHENADRVYRIVRDKPVNMSGGFVKTSVTPSPLAPSLKEEFPEIESAARFIRSKDVLISRGETHLLEDNFFWADAGAFDLLTIPLVKGNPASVLHDPYDILLSESTADRVFGRDDPIGRVLTISGQLDFRVAGVFEDVPANSHFVMNVIVPYETYFLVRNMDVTRWGGNFSYTYILIRESGDPDALEAKFPAFLDKYVYQDYDIPDEYKNIISMQPLTTIHLHSHRNQEIESNNDMVTVILFSSVAILFLVIACINYMNLATARSVKRAREVGIRKVAGAQRRQLIGQFLGESAVMTLLAMAAALLIVHLILPEFNKLVDRQLRLNLLANHPFSIGLVFLTAFVGLFSGMYPAIIISRFKPVSVLSGTFHRSRTGLTLRNILVLVQFSISVFFIIFTFVIRDQLRFMKNRNMGYSRDRIMVLEVNDVNVQRNIRTVKSELMQYAGIEAVSACYRLPNNIDEHSTQAWNRKRPDHVFPMYYNMADYDYVDLFNIEIVQGRTFSRDFPSDAQGAFLVNEAAVKAAEWESPIGQEINLWTGGTARIVGVMKDFHMHSLHRPIEPVLLALSEDQYIAYLSIKIKPVNTSATVDFVKVVMKRISPDYPFEFSFFDDVFERDYHMEQKMGTIFRSISVLAIAVACLGLFGLSTFAAEQRTKEIGIRKILGAPSTGVFTLLSRTFIKWVLISNIIAWPLAYMTAEKWLQNFSYRMQMNSWNFVLSALLAFAIAFFTVSYQSIKASRMNPADSLRYE